MPRDDEKLNASKLHRRKQKLSPLQRRLYDEIIRQGFTLPTTRESEQEAIEHEKTYPLSVHQLEMWRASYADARPLRNTSLLLQVQGQLDLPAFRKAIDCVIERHEILRTNFLMIEGVPAAKVALEQPYDIQTIDLSQTGLDDRLAKGIDLCRKAALKRFRLERGPLFAFAIVKIDASTQILSMIVDHMIFDGWSSGVFMRELSYFYSEKIGEPNSPPPPPLSMQFGDFVLRERARIDKGKMQEAENYWREILRDPAAPVRLKPVRSSQPDSSYIRRTVSKQFPVSLCGKISGFSRNSRTTPFVTAMAGFNILLSWRTNQRDISIISPVANRQSQESQKIIGPFSHSAILRQKINPEASFAELVQTQKGIISGAIEHQYCSLWPVVDELEIPYGHYNFYIAMQNYPAALTQLGPLKITPLDVNYGSTLFDLAIFFTTDIQQISAQIVYDQARFDLSDIEVLWKEYVSVLNRLLDHPFSPIETSRLSDDVGGNTK